MKYPVSYVHPSFEHFLLINLNENSLADIINHTDSEGVIKSLRERGFPFASTCIGQDVRILKSRAYSGPISLISRLSEPTEQVIRFLYDHVARDHDYDLPKRYGPFVVESEEDQSSLVAYYDKTIRRIFFAQVVHALYSDPVTLMTAWYSRVNAHHQKHYLEAIVNQVMSLPGISTIFTFQFNTRRGGIILRDSVRAACIGISLLRQLQPGAPQSLVNTLGFACFVQHFGALCNYNKEYHTGLITSEANQETLQMLSRLGISKEERDQRTLDQIGVRAQDVAELIRARNSSATERPGFLLGECMSVANFIVSTYFADKVGESQNGRAKSEPNPLYRDFSGTCVRLDQTFGKSPFYKKNALKIKQFFLNADRHFKLNIGDRMSRDGYVSATEMQAMSNPPETPKPTIAAIL